MKIRIEARPFGGYTVWYGRWWLGWRATRGEVEMEMERWRRMAAVIRSSIVNGDIGMSVRRCVRL